MRTAILVLLLTLMSGFAAPDAKADMEQKLQQQFNAMVNYTPASVHHGARRGVISGGSLSIRTPNTSVRPFSIQMPSISFGCGGIDAFFGSFSFISKEQLVQAMRSIVTAAISYAFQLALEALCPTCADVLAKIQSELNKMNAGLTNTCEMARNFMNNSDTVNSIASSMRTWAKERGWAEDDWASKKQGSSTSTEHDVAKMDNPEIKAALPQNGNQVWRLLKDKGQTSFSIDGSENALYEEIMSITGTVIVCVSTEEGCSDNPTEELVGQAGELRVFYKKPLLTLTHLIEGDNEAPTKQVFSCAADYDECKNPEIIDKVIIPMAQKVRDAYLGTSTSPGLINRYRYQYSSLPSAEEEAWMKVGGSMTAMVFELARDNPDMARGFVVDHANGIAAEMVLPYFDQMIRRMFVALSRTEMTGMEKTVKAITDAKNAAYKEAQSARDASGSASSVYVAFTALKQANGRR